MTDLGCDIRKLADLLKVEDTHSDSEDDLPAVSLSKAGPGDIGNHQRHKVAISPQSAADSTNIRGQKNDPDDIWQIDEVVNQPVGEEYFDPREQPEYDIKYQQAVSPEDVFLQMNGRTPSTASCENIVITINMKGEKRDAIDLSITQSTLNIRSPMYRLHLPLPHPVDPEKGHAKWDGKKETLSVQLLMVREFDFINF